MKIKQITLLVILLLFFASQVKAIKSEQLLIYSDIAAQWIKKSNNYQTTNSQIYIDNLNANIEVFEKLYKKNQLAQHGIQLANKWYFRYRILGDFNDASKSLELMEHINNRKQLNSNGLFIYATILSGFHHFSEALTVIKLLENKATISMKVSHLKSEILFSLGKYQSTNDSTNPLKTAEYALLHNNLKKANKFYKQALINYTDTDPYKYVWLQLQQGIAFLKHHQIKAAQMLFKDAHRRFPEYYLITEHLAETELLLGHYKIARDLYQLVSEQTNNPEFYAQLALVEKQLGNHKSSQLAFKKAQTGFDKLVAQFPKAIGDHAVGFYLENDQAKKGLTLAISNLENRQNIESYSLLINLALSNKNIGLACNTYKKSQLLQVNPIEYTELSSKLNEKCKVENE